MNSTSLKCVEHILIGVGFLILFTASTYKLSASPAIWYDEGYYTQAAMNICQTGHQVLQVAPNSYVPTTYVVTTGYPLLLPVSVSYCIFGIGVTQGRAVMVLFIIALASAVFFLVRLLYGTATAGWSVLLLATFPMLYGNGKSVLGEVPGLFYLAAALLALLKLERSGWKQTHRYVLVGILAGLCAATKPIFLLFPAAIVLAFIFRYHSIDYDRSGVFAGVVAFSIPLVVWFIIQFDSNFSVAGLLAAYANPYEVSNMGLLIVTNAKRFFTETTPLVTLLLVTCWGISISINDKLRKVSLVELTAFIFTFLILINYLRIEGWYRYFFPGTILALVFFPASIFSIYEAVSLHRSVPRWVSWLPIAVLLSVSLCFVYQTMFSSYVADYYRSTKVPDLISTFDSIPTKARVFMYDVPELAILLPRNQYYQYLHPHPSLEIGKQELIVLAKGLVDYVIVTADTYSQDQKKFSYYVEYKHVNRYIILRHR